jgi:ABC-type oligopeptide transport system ATPase subunit
LWIGLSELLELKEEDPESYRKALYTLFVKLNEKSKGGKIRAEIITGNEEDLNSTLFGDKKIYIAFINRTKELGKFDDFVILVGRKVLLSTFDLGFEKIENPPKLDLLGSVLFAEVIRLYLEAVNIEVSIKQIEDEIEQIEDEERKKDLERRVEDLDKELDEKYNECGSLYDELFTLIRAGLFRKREYIENLHNFINEHIEQKEISGKEHFQLVYIDKIEDVESVLKVAAEKGKRLVLIFNNKYNWFLLFKWSEENQRFEPLLYQLPGKLMGVLKKLSGGGKIDELEEESLEEAEEESSKDETKSVETKEELPRNIHQEVKGPGVNLAIVNSEVAGDVKVEFNFNPEEFKQILESYLQRTLTKEDLENFARNITSIFERIIKSYTTTGKTQELSIGYLIFMLKDQILGQDFNLKYGKFLPHLGEEFTKNLISFVIKKVFYEKDGKTLKRLQSPEDIAKVLSEYVKIINTEVPKAIGHELLKKLLEGKVERNLVIEFFGEHRDILEKFRQAFEKEDEVVLEILGEEIKYRDEEKDNMKKLINKIYEELVGSKVEESEKEKEEKIKEIIKLASEIREYLEKWKEELSDEKEKKIAASLINNIDHILKPDYLKNLSLKQLDDLLQRLQKLLDEIKKEEQVPQATKEEVPEVTPQAPLKEAPEGKPSETPPPAKPVTSPGLSRILNTCGQILGWTLIAVGTPIIALGLATALLPLYALYKMKDQIKSITPDIGKALEVFK